MSTPMEKAIQDMDNLALQEAVQTILELRAERDAAISALRALYDAIPTSFGEDRALNEATKQAEKVLGVKR